MVMIDISKHIYDLSNRDKKRWIKSQSHRQSQDWKDALEQLKDSMDVKRTRSESKDD